MFVFSSLWILFSQSKAFFILGSVDNGYVTLNVWLSPHVCLEICSHCLASLALWSGEQTSSGPDFLPSDLIKERLMCSKGVKNEVCSDVLVILVSVLCLDSSSPSTDSGHLWVLVSLYLLTLFWEEAPCKCASVAQWCSSILRLFLNHAHTSWNGPFTEFLANLSKAFLP